MSIHSCGCHDKEDVVCVGTELKIKIENEPYDGMVMDDYRFAVEFSTKGEPVTVDKSDMIRIDESAYVAIVDTAAMGPGKLKVKQISSIPDDDMPNKVRKVVSEFCTNIKVV